MSFHRTYSNEKHVNICISYYFLRQFLTISYTCIAVKAILALWARYRWGAYEEHGYPGSTKFPYFSKVENAVDDQPKWVATGCTNAPNNMLNGTYLNL